MRVVTVSLKGHIVIDPEIRGGEPVFAGTRVPVSALLGNIEEGVTVDEFLEDFPSVTREQVEAALVASEFHHDMAAANAIMRADADALSRLARS